MKRTIALLLALLMGLSLCACAKEETPQPATEATEATTLPAAEAPTEQTEETQPKWEEASVRVDGSRILWKTLARGTEVTVVGTLDDWYIIKGEDADLVVSQSLIRLSTEPAFASFTGYASWNAWLYPSSDLNEDEGTKLPMNTKLTVVDGTDDWLYVESDKGSGFMSPDKVSKYYINNGVSGSEESGGGASSSGSSGSGGGESGGSSGGNYGADGGDIPLSHRKGANAGVQLLSSWHGPAYKAMEEVSATVLCDNTEAYLCIFYRGDTVRVTEKTDSSCTLLIGELTAELPRWQLCFAEDDPYTAWQGYARRNAVIYADYRMEEELKQFSGNEKLQILDAFDELKLYAVAYNGQTGFMRYEDVSETAIYSGSRSSGNSSGSTGGSSSGSTGGSGVGSSGPEWSLPKW